MMIVIACVSQHKLLQQLRNGEQRVINSFYCKLKKRVWKALVGRYQAYQLQTLEDCFSDAFLVFLEKIRDKDFKANNLQGYAYRIVFLTFKNRLRHRRWLISTSPTELPEPHPELSNVFYSADTLFESANADQLVHWFEKLSAKEQQILNLQLQNYKLKEIAQELELSHGTIRNIRSRLIKEAKEVVI